MPRQLGSEVPPPAPPSHPQHSQTASDLFICAWGELGSAAVSTPALPLVLKARRRFNVRPFKKKKRRRRERKKSLFHSYFLSHCLSSASADNPAVWIRGGGGAAVLGGGGWLGVAWTLGPPCRTDAGNNLLSPYTCASPRHPA